MSVLYRPILGEEGGKQSVQLGFLWEPGRTRVYMAVRLFGRWFRSCA